jgi:methionyl aminopeptidase
MGIFIKNDEQIQLMRVAGRIVRDTHELLAKQIRPGITTGELAKVADEFIRSCGGTPTFLGYRGFPSAICASVNNEVIHGVPGTRRLRNGDIVSIDIGVTYKRFHGDAARTHAVGKVTPEHARLIEVTKQSYFEGMAFAKEGTRLHDISAAIGDYVQANGFSVVTEWCGHGIGRQLHEDPQIPHTRQQKRGPRLARGMTLAVEPMVNVGAPELLMNDDTWTVLTRDGAYSAHYENTCLVTDGEPDILTL